MKMKKFDLNIEKVLEDWEVYHAVREVIANALDEPRYWEAHRLQVFYSRRRRGRRRPKVL